MGKRTTEASTVTGPRMRRGWRASAGSVAHPAPRQTTPSVTSVLPSQRLRALLLCPFAIISLVTLFLTSIRKVLATTRAPRSAGGWLSQGTPSPRAAGGRVCMKQLSGSTLSDPGKAILTLTQGSADGVLEGQRVHIFGFASPVVSQLLDWCN